MTNLPKLTQEEFECRVKIIETLKNRAVCEYEQWMELRGHPDRAKHMGELTAEIDAFERCLRTLKRKPRKRKGDMMDHWGSMKSPDFMERLREVRKLRKK